MVDAFKLDAIETGKTVSTRMLTGVEIQDAEVVLTMPFAPDLKHTYGAVALLDTLCMCLLRVASSEDGKVFKYAMRGISSDLAISVWQQEGQLICKHPGDSGKTYRFNMLSALRESWSLMMKYANIAEKHTGQPIYVMGYRSDAWGKGSGLY